MITFRTLKYWRRLRGTTCTTKLPWRNGTRPSPDARPRTTPQPRKREHLQLSRIPEEADAAIIEETLPLNLITYSDATPLQVDPACLADFDTLLPADTRKESRPTTENYDRKFSRPEPCVQSKKAVRLNPLPTITSLRCRAQHCSRCAMNLRRWL
jgi:hypothetical protein